MAKDWRERVSMGSLGTLALLVLAFGLMDWAVAAKMVTAVEAVAWAGVVANLLAVGAAVGAAMVALSIAGRQAAQATEDRQAIAAMVATRVYGPLDQLVKHLVTLDQMLPEWFAMGPPGAKSAVDFGRFLRDDLAKISNDDLCRLAALPNHAGYRLARAIGMAQVNLTAMADFAEGPLFANISATGRDHVASIYVKALHELQHLLYASLADLKPLVEAHAPTPRIDEVMKA